MLRDLKLFLLVGVFGLLETAQATTVTYIPVDNNYAQDADMNGVFDTLATKYSPYFLLRSSLSQDPFLGIEPGDVRSGLEFDISGIPQGAIITSATFSIYAAGGFTTTATRTPDPPWAEVFPATPATVKSRCRISAI